MTQELFKDFTIKEPTKEEHRAASLKWLSRVQPTLIDQWPKEMAALSIQTTMVAFPSAMIDEFFAIHEQKAPGPIMNEVASEIDAKIGWSRKFFRLNSRSPKDYPFPFKVPVSMSGKEILTVMADSMRIMDDLLEFKYVPEQPAFICLRDFIPGIRPEWEFRCFVKNGDLLAVSHYDYMKKVKAPQDNGDEIREKIDTYFAQKLKPVLHVDTVVFDLWMKPDNSFLLIEINPYGLSDPCHFGNYGNIENARIPIAFEKVETEVKP